MKKLLIYLINIKTKIKMISTRYIKKFIDALDLFVFCEIFYIVYVLIKDLFIADMNISQKIGAVTVIFICIYVVLRIILLIRHQKTMEKLIIRKDQ